MKNAPELNSPQAFYITETVLYPLEPGYLIVRGSIVFACAMPHPGVADTTKIDGEPHLAVTLEPGGGYPCWNVPTRILLPAIPMNN
ncbi:hypothetical protein GF108_03505 [Phyllobacterium sp. SYP-B3895]|uniref:hypothetical protein n=1 Tax=Phyllobacterium sp. SYP-B3895 TaxID=2663240 RepID=UPI001299D1DD|nr:hypothetical protein [Phyllobacterium sp. SYP-B3895]MRG54646.1 hypothetical protein [Phyllobacterium sp. SYP-B3895]